jgi:hypothetical protein
VTEAPRIIPDKLTITYSEAEMQAFYRYAAARQDRGLDESTFWSALCIAIFGIGGIAVAAYYAGLLQSTEMRAVALTAYVAFAAGVVTYGVVTRVHYAQVVRKFHSRTAQTKKVWKVSFDTSGFSFKSDTSETRVPWSGVDAFDDHCSMMLLWFEGTQSIFLPARVFRDEHVRTNFVAAVAKRIEAAKKA